MKLDVLPVEFQAALPILRQFQAAGFEAYYVGGSVRDILLNQPIHDVDIATSAFPEEIKRLFPRTIDVGIDHGTVMIVTKEATYEVTTFRTESTYQDFRRPDHVEFVRSLREDLKRRDFTINALAMGLDGEIIDLFDGVSDLQQKILRAVGNPDERFHEDALRMMRAVRFVSQLGFQLEDKTAEAVLKYHSLLEKISVERIHVEFVKLLMGPFRQAGLRAFVASECYIYCPRLREYGEELLRFAELEGPAFATEAQAWMLLLLLLPAEAPAVQTFLKAWKCSNQLIRKVDRMLPALKFRLKNNWTAWELYQLSEESALLVEGSLGYFQQQPQVAHVRECYRALPIHSLQELNLNGNDLGKICPLPPGPWIRLTLQALEKAVVEGKLANEHAALAAFAATFLREEKLWENK